MRLSSLLEKHPHLSHASQADPVITMLSADSRQIEQGGLFAAISGSSTDGHDYIDDAIAAGAAALLVEKGDAIPADTTVPVIISAQIKADFAKLCSQFWSARPDMVVGITGTNGKTSTSQYLHQIWSKAAWPSAALGTLGLTQADGHTIAAGQALTTPTAEHFFTTLAEQKRAGISHFCFEASSHGLAQHRLSGLGVNVALFTNLSHDHLDYHGDMDSYFEAKAVLFEQNLLEGGTAVINIDDSWGQKLSQRLKSRHIVLWTVGNDPSADFRIESISLESFGADVSIDAKGTMFRFPLALSGKIQALNAVMAAVVAHASGLPLQDSFGALPSLRATSGRMEAVYGHPHGARIVVDYAHSPDALEKALENLRAETSGKLKLVFGCGGDRDHEKRPVMGRIAHTLCDEVFVTDDNPRSEPPHIIREMICAECPDAHNIASRDDAIKQAILSLEAADTLLIAGKGHELTQTIGTESLPFDDRAQARSAIEALKASLS